MDQVLINGSSDTLSNSATEYNAYAGGIAWVINESNRKKLISAPGKLKNLYVELSAAPGAGDAFIFTLMVNGVASSLAVTISGGADTQDFDATEVDVVAGDEVTIRSTYTGTPGTPYARWSFMFAGDNAKESNISGAGHLTDSLDWAQIHSYIGIEGFIAPEDAVRVVIPTAGTIKNLYVGLDGPPGAGGDAWTLTLRKGTPPGAMGDTALEVTITNAATTGNHTADDVAVSAGDVVTMQGTKVNTPANRIAWWGFTFVADTDGESLILGSSVNNLINDGTVEYLGLNNAHYIRAWDATEADRYQLGQAMVLKKLYVLLSGAPNQGGDVADAYTFKVRLNSADPGGGLSVTIADTDVSGNDVANSITVTNNYDELALKHQAADTPTVVDAYWGLVAYVDPAPAGGNAGSAAAGAAMLLM